MTESVSDQRIQRFRKISGSLAVTVAMLVPDSEADETMTQATRHLKDMVDEIPYADRLNHAMAGAIVSCYYNPWPYSKPCVTEAFPHTNSDAPS